MKRISLLAAITIILFSFTVLDKPTGLTVGEMAPDFTAKDQNGKELNLKKNLNAGPVVLIFYRGEWCPYCNKQLKELEDSMPMITAKGATIIAVSPEKMENVTKTIEKTKATYSIISDQNLKIMRAYKGAYELDAKTTEAYKGYGIDLKEKNGSNGNNLPVPAIYIINKQGKITYRHFDEDFKKRASVKEILSNL